MRATSQEHHASDAAQAAGVSRASSASRAPAIAAAALGIAAVVMATREPLYAWQPALAAGMLLLTPRAIVRVLAAMTLALLLLGGLVTTYRVGMAVPDWPQTMGRNMFAYPLDEMLSSGWGVTLEHSHRLWASAVGLVTLMLVVVCALRRARRGLLQLASIALVAVIVQGVLGGTRVLENNVELAFLHGAFAQVFYGLVIALWVLSSRRWETAAGEAQGLSMQSGAREQAAAALSRVARFAAVVLAVVYAQVVLGAWLRHSGQLLALVLHILAACAVFGLVFWLARAVRGAVPQDAEGRLLPARALSRWLLGALYAQVLFGVLATVAILGISRGFEGRVSMLEALTATIHVALGASLLGGVVASWMWTRRTAADLARARANESEYILPQGRAATQDLRKAGVVARPSKVPHAQDHELSPHADAPNWKAEATS